MQNEMILGNLELNLRDLPMVITFKVGKSVKEYVLKTNKDKTSLFLNKKEY